MCTRRPNESFEDYKARRREEQKATANRLLCCPSFGSHDEVVLCKKYNMNRHQFRKTRIRATREYKTAKELGYSDTEILDALYTGDLAQAAYAKFIEHEIVGKV